jgi:hypothetical protein
MPTNNDMVKLSDGDIRFILWVLDNTDTSSDEGMRYYAGRQEYGIALRKRLKDRLPEFQPKPQQ